MASGAGSAAGAIGGRRRRPAHPARLAAAAGLLAALAAVPLLTGNVFHLHLGNLIFLNAIFVLSLALIARTGQLSLCHAAFAGVGAYTSGLLSLDLGVPPAIAALIGAAAAAVIALLMGLVILRLRGVYFVLVTFLFGQVFNLLVLDAQDLTRGANGLVGIPSIKLLGVSFGSPYMFYFLSLGVAALTFTFLWALLRSPVGRAFASIEENVQLAESSGIDTRSYQVLAFTIGSALAGLGGALLAHYVHYISPDTFTFWESVSYIVMLVVGGRSSLAGGLLGVAFLTPLPEFLRGTEALQHIIYGSILIVVLLFLPGGLISIGTALRRRRPAGRRGRR